MIDRLIEAIEAKQNPTVVGLDPQLDMIPEAIVSRTLEEAKGEALLGASRALLEYNVAIIDEIYDLVPAVKPQIAMYERFGPAGVEAYRKTIAYAKEKGLIVIGDVKRGDIASTAKAYADGHLGSLELGGKAYVPFDTDFITVNAYMGRDAIEPFFHAMKELDRGLFVLIRTSNPGSEDLQDLLVEHPVLGRVPVYEASAHLVKTLGDAFLGRYGYSDIGGVVGATYPEQGRLLREKYPSIFFLVPGYGAQGGSASDLKDMFDAGGRGVIVNSSRGIIAAWRLDKYKSRFRQDEFAKAARQAVLDMKDDLNSVRP